MSPRSKQGTEKSHIQKISVDLRPGLNNFKLIKEHESLNQNWNELREILQKICFLGHFSFKLRGPLAGYLA